MNELTDQDKTIISFLEEEIYPLASTVGSFYGSFQYTQVETSLCDALSYEARTSGINLDREVAVTQYDTEIVMGSPQEVDFLVYSNQNSVDLESSILIEAKHNPGESSNSSYECRFQLFRNLYSAKQNKSDDLINANYGVCLFWGNNSLTKGEFPGAKESEYLLFENDTYVQMELWKPTDESRTAFERIWIKQDTSVDASPTVSLDKLTVPQIKKILDQFGFEYSSKAKLNTLKHMLLELMSENN